MEYEQELTHARLNGIISNYY